MPIIAQNDKRRVRENLVDQETPLGRARTTHRVDQEPPLW